MFVDDEQFRVAISIQLSVKRTSRVKQNGESKISSQSQNVGKTTDHTYTWVKQPIIPTRG